MSGAVRYAGKHRARRKVFPYLPAVILLSLLFLVISGLTASLFHASSTQSRLAAEASAAEVGAESEAPLDDGPAYGSGLPVLEQCPDATSATANFRGKGFAGCDFVTLVGNELAGPPPAEYQYLSIVNPTTGEPIDVNCQATQDPAMNDLWLCATHYGSQMYIYP
ncbi:hypothetical protein [Corynebacterium sputi]|uniref:hypothetical protein n=1 Tax=Corynebacterium sputi TaxID=489915 RepID=UPI00047D6A4A|nr:hypothetical protein [Corynebacterium sputi]